jgi:hypothetical protein
VKALTKIFLSSLLLAGALALIPAEASAQSVKSPGSGAGTPLPGGAGKPASSSVLPYSTVVKVLQQASQVWGIPFPDLLKAYQSGQLIIIQTGPNSFRVVYDGSTLDLILDDL